MNISYPAVFRWLFCFVLWLGTSPAIAQENTMQNSKVKVTLIGGYDYATGSYGQPADTTIRSTPVTIKLDSLEWVAKFQTSYIRIRQTPKPPPTGGTPSEFRRFQSEGIGDTTISLAKKSWFRWGGINFFNTGVKVKLATASREKQLGTGEEDWMIELDGYRSSGKWLPFATIGYRWYGDTEETPREDLAACSTIEARTVCDSRTARSLFLTCNTELIPDGRQHCTASQDYQIRARTVELGCSLFIADASETRSDIGLVASMLGKVTTQ